MVRPASVTSPKNETIASLPHVQGASAIRSLEMALQPGMRGRDRPVFDNLEAVEGRFLSP
jgi:hypothetical protein